MCALQKKQVMSQEECDWEEIFNRRNGNRWMDSKKKIDLHHLTRRQANMALKKYLPDSLAPGKGFKIITGHGKHSGLGKGGKKHPVLIDHVKNYLLKKNFPPNYTIEKTKNGGALLIRNGELKKKSKRKINKNILSARQLKSSDLKTFRKELLAEYPQLAPCIKDILPRKGNIKEIVCSNQAELLLTDTAEGNVLFVKSKDMPYIPTLRLVHKYPFILPQHRVDEGTIRSILNGSNVTCLDLKSQNAFITTGLEKHTVVAIMAEGKQHAMCIGIMTMSSTDISLANSGIGVESIQYLNDELWKATIDICKTGMPLARKRKRLTHL